MGSDAVPAFKGMPNPIHMAEVEVERYGNDLALSSLLHDPWLHTSNQQSEHTFERIQEQK